MKIIDKHNTVERDPLYILGRAIGKQESQDKLIKNLIVKLCLSDEQIHAATEATITYIKTIRASLIN